MERFSAKLKEAQANEGGVVFSEAERSTARMPSRVPRDFRSGLR